MACKGNDFGMEVGIDMDKYIKNKMLSTMLDW